MGAALRRRGRLPEVGAVGPAADAEQDLQVAVAALEQVELLEAAVQLVAVFPPVAVPVNLLVCPAIG